MAKKERREGIAGAAADRQRQARRRDQPGVLRAIREHRQLISPIGQQETGDDDQARAAGAQLCRGGEGARQQIDSQSREVRELETVGHDDIGKRGQTLGDRFGDAGAHEHAGLVVPDHGIAAVRRSRVRGTDGRDRTGNHVGYSRIAEVAAEHGRAAREHAARLEAAKDLIQLLGPQLVPAPGAVAWMVRQLHGVEREDSKPSRCSGRTAALLPT